MLLCVWATWPHEQAEVHMHEHIWLLTAHSALQLTHLGIQLSSDSFHMKIEFEFQTTKSGNQHRILRTHASEKISIDFFLHCKSAAYEPVPDQCSSRERPAFETRLDLGRCWWLLCFFCYKRNLGKFRGMLPDGHMNTPDASWSTGTVVRMQTEIEYVKHGLHLIGMPMRELWTGDSASKWLKAYGTQLGFDARTLSQGRGCSGCMCRLRSGLTIGEFYCRSQPLHNYHGAFYWPILWLYAFTLQVLGWLNCFLSCIRIWRSHSHSRISYLCGECACPFCSWVAFSLDDCLTILFIQVLDMTIRMLRHRLHMFTSHRSDKKFNRLQDLVKSWPLQVTELPVKMI